MNKTSALHAAARRASLRLRCERGATTILVSLGVLTVSLLLVTGALYAAESDIGNTQHDADAKRAYNAARAGVNDFLQRLNTDTNYWRECPSQSKTSVPGSTSTKPLDYAFVPVPANPAISCASDPEGRMIDQATGSFRFKFTGYSGGNREVRRDLVAGFKRDSPLDYVWYSIYETANPNTYRRGAIPASTAPVPPDPAQITECTQFIRDGRPNTCSPTFGPNNNNAGPMYTQDQFHLCGSPTLGRDSSDDIVSRAGYADDPAPGASPWHLSPVLWKGPCGGSYSPDIKGTLRANGPEVSLPSSNSGLLTDASDPSKGTVYAGTTTVLLNGDSATVTNNGATTVQDLTAKPLIYVTNNGACGTQYWPFMGDFGGYPRTGVCGNVYVSGTYTAPVTIGAAKDVIIEGDIKHNDDDAVLGLVANDFVRIMHGVSGRDGYNKFQCGAGAANIPATTAGYGDADGLQIDAAILAVNQTFHVDNPECGTRVNNFDVFGSIAQKFHGDDSANGCSCWPGTPGPGNPSGYIKNFEYDDRLETLTPPYMFDISISGWHLMRETLCVAGGSGSSGC